MQAKLNPPLSFPSPTSLVPVVRRAAAALARGLARLREAHAHQRLGADELRSMSELELRDLGIGRSEVPRVLRGEPR